MGVTSDTPIMVQVLNPPAPVAAPCRAPTLPHLHMIRLMHAAALQAECEALPQWQPGTTHSIPLLYAFMKPLGGCTRTDQLYWRDDERHIAHVLLAGRFPSSTGRSTKAFVRQQAILKGPPGTGKSVMLCVMTMYLALVKKQNVVVVRRLHERHQTYSLYFVGHRRDQVVCCTKQDCELDEAYAIYRTLETHPDFSSPESPHTWLMLDGFFHSLIPVNLTGYALLTGSQNVDIKSNEMEGAYSCLYPSWRRDDLFALGKSIFQWGDATMRERFYYSGGNVCAFTLESMDEMIEMMDMAVSSVTEPSHILTGWATTSWDETMCACLRRTFVKPDKQDDPWAYQMWTSWDRVVDSEYALVLLQARLLDKDIAVLLAWACASGAGYASLARTLLEMWVRSLAANNALDLLTVPYDKLATVNPHSGQRCESRFEPLDVKRGSVHQSGSTVTEVDAVLAAWRDSSTDSYWHATCPCLPTVDSIVKRTTGGVAYLHMTVSTRHRIDTSELNKLNTMFVRGGSDTPLYVVVCPTRAAAKEMVLGPQDAVLAAAEMCDLHVAYCGESIA